MTYTILENPTNLQSLCKVQTLLDKIENAIKLYKMGVYPIEILFHKIQEFSEKLEGEVYNDND